MARNVGVMPMPNPIESLIDVRGARLLVRRGGAGAPLLFLHGTPGLANWWPGIDRLAVHFDVLAPDHPGFGRSEDPGTIDNIADLANFYLDALDALAIPRVHVVGHQIGGWAGMEMSMRSERVASLTLVAAAGLHVDSVPKGDLFICSPDELPALFFADEQLGRDVLTNEFSGQDEGIPHRNRMMAARLAWHPRLMDPNLGKWLHRVKVPTNLVWGDEDRVLPIAHAHGLAKKIQGARLTVLPRCGHLPYIECPDAFAAAVSGFIRGVR